MRKWAKMSSNPAGSRGGRLESSPSRLCARMKKCHDFLQLLQPLSSCMEPRHDQCYCADFAAAVRMPDVLEQDSEHGSAYKVPRDWCCFVLKVPPRAYSMDVFKKWVVSYHGCPSNVPSSILEEGQLLMPGDRLLDGSKLPNRLTRGSSDRIGLYTSPSIRYSELDIYTKPATRQGSKVRVVLQCRQNLMIAPPALGIEGETIAWMTRFGDAEISRHFPNSEIERYTDARNSIIPYRILVDMDIVTREEEQTQERCKAEEDLARLEGEVIFVHREKKEA